MLRRIVMTLVAGVAFFVVADCQQAAGQGYALDGNYGGQALASAYNQYGAYNMERFYHYPYVTYPHNYWGGEYFRSSGHMYNRYPQEMRVPLYNRAWQNYYPSSRRYHWGHHFILDVF